MLPSSYPHAFPFRTHEPTVQIFGEPMNPEPLNGYLLLYIPYYPDHVKLDFVFSKKFNPSRPPPAPVQPLQGKGLGAQKYGKKQIRSRDIKLVPIRDSKGIRIPIEEADEGLLLRKKR
jgi:hypothetical protein